MEGYANRQREMSGSRTNDSIANGLLDLLPVQDV